MEAHGMITNFMVTDVHGVILLAKYYDNSDAKKRGLWEHKLFHQTKCEWGSIRPNYKVDEVVVATKGIYTTSAAGDSEDGFHIAIIDGTTVVFHKVNDIVCFVSGNGQFCETYLCDVLRFLIDVMQSQCVKTMISVVAFRDAESFGKILTCIDEVIYKGIIEQLDLEVILKRFKMKNF
ncbi:hypothetical protein WA158_000299 [Blastocystis sp. Blastoise]